MTWDLKNECILPNGAFRLQKERGTSSIKHLSCIGSISPLVCGDGFCGCGLEVVDYGQSQQKDSFPNNLIFAQHCKQRFDCNKGVTVIYFQQFVLGFPNFLRHLEKTSVCVCVGDNVLNQGMKSFFGNSQQHLSETM